MELTSSQLVRPKRKMSCKEEKVLELVEMLLSLLDARSISRLAQVHQLTVELLWNDLVRRACPYDENSPEKMHDQYEFCDLVQDMFEEQKRAMKHLIKLLKRWKTQMSFCCSSFM